MVLPRKYRTTSKDIHSLHENGSTATSPATENGDGVSLNQSQGQPGLLLTRQALNTYQSNNHLIHYKYGTYGKSWIDLPK